MSCGRRPMRWGTVATSIRRCPGLPELRQAVAAANRRFYGLEVDWASEVVVTSGATEAVTACLIAVLNPGDEVVLIEPLYDTYAPVVRLLGAIPRFVRLEPPDWDLPRGALADAFGPATKAILLNSPMNPCGKVFTAEELGFIAELTLRHDCLCDLRRGVRAPDLRRRPPHSADDPAGDARADHADRQRRQDVLADRVEGGLRHRAGGAGDQCGKGAPESHLHDGAQSATGGRGGAGEGRCVFRLAVGGLAGQARPARGGAGWPGDDGASQQGAAISSPPTSARSGSTATTWRSAGTSPSMPR